MAFVRANRCERIQMVTNPYNDPCHPWLVQATDETDLDIKDRAMVSKYLLYVWRREDTRQIE